jgi:hypothetical protein
VAHVGMFPRAFRAGIACRNDRCHVHGLRGHGGDRAGCAELNAKLHRGIAIGRRKNPRLKPIRFCAFKQRPEGGFCLPQGLKPARYVRFICPAEAGPCYKTCSVELFLKLKSRALVPYRLPEYGSLSLALKQLSHQQMNALSRRRWM